MPFDEDLRRQFETLSDRIRNEVMRQLATATGELTTSLQSERAAVARQAAADASATAEQDAASRLAEAVVAAEDRAGARLAEAVAAAEDHAGARLAEALAAAEDRAAVRLTEAVAAAEDRAAARLTEAVAAAEDRGRLAGHEAGKGDGLAQGRQQARDDAFVEARAIELAAGDRLVEAVRAIDRARSLSEILDTVASRAGCEAARVGVLLVRGGQLRGWRFIGFDPALDDAAAFELPLDQSGIIVEAVRTGEAASGVSGPGVTVPSFATPPPGREMLVVPIPMNGQVVAVLYADQAAGDRARDQSQHQQPRVVWPATLEVMTRHATRCLEAVTALRAAQILTEHPDTSATLAASRAAGGSDAREPGSAANATIRGDEDEAAQRYARLLVSEIKLYHEPEVIAGRRDRDVAARLGGEIAHARVLYDQRVPAHVRAATDHFHAELVRTLANGDPLLLGQTS